MVTWKNFKDFLFNVYESIDEELKSSVSSNSQTIDKLINEAHFTAVSKGWWGENGDEDRNFPEQIALMHSELSEVLEEYRTYGNDINRYIYTESDKPEGIAVEFADLLIRVFDTCGRYNIPLEEALKLKMKYNKTRPHRHGGKVC